MTTLDNIRNEFEELFANYTTSEEEKQIFLDFIEKVYWEGWEDCEYTNDLK